LLPADWFFRPKSISIKRSDVVFGSDYAVDISPVQDKIFHGVAAYLEILDFKAPLIEALFPAIASGLKIANTTLSSRAEIFTFTVCPVLAVK